MLPTPEALYDQAACGLVLTDPSGLILSSNRTFADWVGRSQAELVGTRRIQDLLTVGGRLFHHTHLQPLLQIQGSVAEVKVEIVRPDGRRVPMLMNAVRREHDAEKFDDLAFMVVPDRHKYEQELLKARGQLEALNARLSEVDKHRMEFLATLAHELRNPLVPIRNGLEILKGAHLRDGPERARAMMERQVRHMVRLIEDLMDLSRISSGKLEVRLERISVRELIDSAVEASAPAVAAGGHAFRVDVPHEPVYLDADLTRLSQVLANVINNAAKYTPDNGSIVVEAKDQGGQLEIRVRDNGAGIPPEHLDSVFGFFAQVGATRNLAQGGLGIGLALARTITELHGGTITAESEGLGRGTTFVMVLPVS